MVSLSYQMRRSSQHWAVQVAVLLLLLLFLNEFLIYYLLIAQCSWPTLPTTTTTPSTFPLVHAMILADVHMLGPRNGHWWDKLRREWQMHRAFQTAIQLHRPEVVFILGDLFDEGQNVNDAQFDEYAARFRRLFSVPAGVRVYGSLGNHDVGFHYRMRSDMVHRFRRSGVYRNAAANGLVTVGGVNFVIVNSMALERDGCTLCRSAEVALELVAKRLACRRPDADQNSDVCRKESAASRGGDYTAPVLLQHFPTWRRSDAECWRRDEDEPLEVYRERWEVLSENATRWLAQTLEPRVVFSGHSHRFCATRTIWDVEEWTVNSFSWRNGNRPKFLLATFGGVSHAVEVCSMPRETTVCWLYGLVGAGGLIFIVAKQRRRR